MSKWAAQAHDSKQTHALRVRFHYRFFAGVGHSHTPAQAFQLKTT